MTNEEFSDLVNQIGTKAKKTKNCSVVLLRHDVYDSVMRYFKETDPLYFFIKNKIYNLDIVPVYSFDEKTEFKVF